MKIYQMRSKILIINRPISLYKSFAVSGGFNYFTNKDESIYYKKLIKDYKLDYIAYLGNDENLMHLKNCTNGIYKRRKILDTTQQETLLIEVVITMVTYTILIIINCRIVNI